MSFNQLALHDKSETPSANPVIRTWTSNMASGDFSSDQVIYAPAPGRMLDLATVLAAIAGAGLAFQVGHFAEHAIQFAVWILGERSNICGRDTPWMSPWVTEAVRRAGTMMFPAANAQRQMMLGMEILHLIGNGIFLTSLGCLYYCIRAKWIRWALYIEGFHLYEHLMLSLSAYFVGKPIGLSTLFGGSDVLGDREFAVGYRVTWHFAMNLLPMPFAMVGLMEHMRRKPARRTVNRLQPPAAFEDVEGNRY